MQDSPGHQKYPEHAVREEPLVTRMRVVVDGEVVADSTDVIRVNEDENPPRYYFPRDDVKMRMLAPSDTTSECPFKGIAHYFDLKAGDKKLHDAVWTYEDPYREHLALKDRVAFWDDKVPGIEIETLGN